MNRAINLSYLGVNGTAFGARTRNSKRTMYILKKRKTYRSECPSLLPEPAAAVTTVTIVATVCITLLAHFSITTDRSSLFMLLTVHPSGPASSLRSLDPPLMHHNIARRDATNVLDSYVSIYCVSSLSNIGLSRYATRHTRPHAFCHPLEYLPRIM